jgi:hypothetical protein
MFPKETGGKGQMIMTDDSKRTDYEQKLYFFITINKGGEKWKLRTTTNN